MSQTHITPAFTEGDPVRITRDHYDRRPTPYLKAGKTGTIYAAVYDDHRATWRYVVKVGISGWYVDEAALEKIHDAEVA